MLLWLMDGGLTREPSTFCFIVTGVFFNWLSYSLPSSEEAERLGQCQRCGNRWVCKADPAPWAGWGRKNPGTQLPGWQCLSSACLLSLSTGSLCCMTAVSLQKGSLTQMLILPMLPCHPEPPAVIAFITLWAPWWGEPCLLLYLWYPAAE